MCLFYGTISTAIPQQFIHRVTCVLLVMRISLCTEMRTNILLHRRNKKDNSWVQTTPLFSPIFLRIRRITCSAQFEHLLTTTRQRGWSGRITTWQSFTGSRSPMFLSTQSHACWRYGTGASKCTLATQNASLKSSGTKIRTLRGGQNLPFLFRGKISALNYIIFRR